LNVELGISLSSELHTPKQLIEQARRAEEIGMTFGLISDHFHPWIDKQGQSPFVWSVIGAISQATSRLRLGTGVTCPLIRTHPAIIAQAAATSAVMMPGRFFLGVGTGENLNEHILGDHWPEVDVRLEMLEEAVEVIRLLWRGETVSHRGQHYVVENARIYTRPVQAPPIMVAASGEKAASVAGKIGDGFVGTAPNAEAIQTFEASGGRGKPRYGQMMVCWDADERAARRTAFELWPTAALGGELNQELKLPAHFQQAVSRIREEDVAGIAVCGPDPAVHLAKIREYEKAGYDHIYVHQVGRDQEGFFRFYQREILPKLELAPAQPQPVAAG
jgi:coenzyme F420-dependent glucose-6-phosphate dehydrogenase